MNFEQKKVEGRQIANFRGFEGVHAIDRARALAEWGQYDDALRVIDTCLMLQSDMDNARFNRAAILTYMGEYEKAIDDYDFVINYKNEAGKPSAHKDMAVYSRGFCGLSLGRLQEGFAEYVAGRPVPENLPPATRYDGGQSLVGKTLFVVGEASMSDNLLFSRYLSLVHADVVFAVPPPLQPLYHFVPGIRLAMRAIGHYDYWCPLMSLAVISRTTAETIPSLPDLRLPLDQTIRWRPDLGLSTARRVGLCWSGSESKGSIPLELLSPLFDIKGIEYFSFQKEVRMEDKKAFDRLDVFAMGQKFENYVDAACAMKSMDLIITVDCAIAHLAGTLGVPCWLLLPKRKIHWLWASKKNTCAWYPSVRLFKQFADNDWSSVVTEVGNKLVSFCRL